MKNPNTNSVQVGKRTVDLRYDSAAIQILDERGINVYSPDSYAEFNPNKLKLLVWAGQLHEPKPLALGEVTKELPTKIKAYKQIAEAIAQAIRIAISDEDAAGEQQS